MQLPERGHLLEGDRALAEELEQREEPSHHVQGVLAVGHQGPERGRADPPELANEDRGLLADADPRGMHVRGREHRNRLGRQRARRQQGQLGGTQSEQHLREQPGVALLQPHGAREAARLLSEPGGHPRGDLLVGPVLQQPREQQVAGLQQREILLVLHVARGQQPGGLQVEQGGRHDQELGGLPEVPRGPLAPDVGDELVGDLGQGHFGHVQLVLGDQAEQQVERPLEVVQVHLEGAAAPGGGLRLLEDRAVAHVETVADPARPTTQPPLGHQGAARADRLRESGGVRPVSLNATGGRARWRIPWPPGPRARRPPPRARSGPGRSPGRGPVAR